MSRANITWTINALTAICAAKPRRTISSATTMAATPWSISSRPRPRKRRAARRQWKAARSRPSVTTADCSPDNFQSKTPLEFSGGFLFYGEVAKLIATTPVGSGICGTAFLSLWPSCHHLRSISTTPFIESPLKSVASLSQLTQLGFVKANKCIIAT
jgi:hypothetical protein